MLIWINFVTSFYYSFTLIAIDENINKLNTLTSILRKKCQQKRSEKSRFLHTVGEIVENFAPRGEGFVWGAVNTPSGSQHARILIYRGVSIHTPGRASGSSNFLKQ